jgi:general secretion pathway protein D
LKKIAYTFSTGVEIMRKHASVRFVSLFLILCLLSPVATLAGDGKKYFKEGLKAEAAEDWDTAVEKFALAVSENPKNAEYRLHYFRALFNASQMYMRRGNALAEQKDYVGAYNAYRKAYAYDPANELAKTQMEKMLLLIEEKKPAEKTSAVSILPTNYKPQLPPKLEKLRDLPFTSPVELTWLIKELAKDLDLNVIFDSQSRLEGRRIKIELKNVTAAKALDYIFLQENLFFQKVGPRTILVADNNRRQFFQQLVLRTFYLSNADPQEIAKIVQSAIPVQPGRSQPIPLIDKATNSITIRDTEENIRIIGKLIKSLDKDRAEVVMDVNIYEVSRQDLLKLGNQIGDEIQLSTLGVSTPGLILGGGTLTSLPKNTRDNYPTAMASALLVPSSTLSAFQRKAATRLIASTQVHAFNGEKSTAKIGQKVPIRSAQITTGGITTPGSTSFVSDVISYENTGLNLEFEPLIFPNQDVQVKMSITSRDIAGVGVNNNPIFVEREIKGSARVQNNRTLLLASVAQNREERGKSGLPLLGLVPIIGRLFSTPTKNDNATDILIAVTPRVLRAPVILPEDEAERPTGSISTPTNSSLEAALIQEELEEQLANARKLGNTATVQLPDKKLNEVPEYVRSQDASKVNQPKQENETPIAFQNTLKPIDTTNKAIELKTVAQNINSTSQTNEFVTSSKESDNNDKPRAELMMISQLPQMKTGDKARVAVIIKTSTPFRSAILGLAFNPSKLAIRSIQLGDIFGSQIAKTEIAPFFNLNGKTFVALSPNKDVMISESGVLAYIEIEALSEGIPEIAFAPEIMNILTNDGRTFELKLK